MDDFRSVFSFRLAYSWWRNYERKNRLDSEERPARRCLNDYITFSFCTKLWLGFPEVFLQRSKDGSMKMFQTSLDKRCTEALQITSQYTQLIKSQLDHSSSLKVKLLKLSFQLEINYNHSPTHSRRHFPTHSSFSNFLLLPHSSLFLFVFSHLSHLPFFLSPSLPLSFFLFFFPSLCMSVIYLSCGKSCSVTMRLQGLYRQRFQERWGS